MTENRIFTLCRMITGVVFLRMVWNFISSLKVKRRGCLSFLVGTINNVLVMEIGWTDVGNGGYILVSCAHSNTIFFFLTISYCIFQFQWVKHATSDYGTQIVHIVFDWLLRTWKDIIFNFVIWLFVLVQTWIVKTILRHCWNFFSNIRHVFNRILSKKHDWANEHVSE
jgi:hypothetical protein